MTSELAGKTALVTGAGSGIGRRDRSAGTTDEQAGEKHADTRCGAQMRRNGELLPKARRSRRSITDANRRIVQPRLSRFSLRNSRVGDKSQTISARAAIAESPVPAGGASLRGGRGLDRSESQTVFTDGRDQRFECRGWRDREVDLESAFRWLGRRRWVGCVAASAVEGRNLLDLD